MWYKGSLISLTTPTQDSAHSLPTPASNSHKGIKASKSQKCKAVYTNCTPGRTVVLHKDTKMLGGFEYTILGTQASVSVRCHTGP